MSVFNCLPRVNALDVRANLPHMEQSLLKFKGNGTEKTEVVQLVDGKKKIPYWDVFSFFVKPKI